jgi:hypothetical protein
MSNVNQSIGRGVQVSTGQDGFARFQPGRDGVEGALVFDGSKQIRGRVCVDTLRTNEYRITVTQADSFLKASEARRLAAALVWAADESDAIS